MAGCNDWVCAGSSDSETLHLGVTRPSRPLGTGPPVPSCERRGRGLSSGSWRRLNEAEVAPSWVTLIARRGKGKKAVPTEAVGCTIGGGQEVKNN